MKERILISWVGLRGAVPIILATFPLLAEVRNAGEIFNLVFFIVITSVLFQGTSIPAVVRWLGLTAPQPSKPRYPLEFEAGAATDTMLTDFIVPYNSGVVGKPIVDIELPKESVIALVCRDSKYLVPAGKTVLQAGDVLLVLLDKDAISDLQKTLSTPKRQ